MPRSRHLPRKAAVALVLMAVLFSLSRVAAHRGGPAPAGASGRPAAARTLATSATRGGDRVRPDSARTMAAVSNSGGPCSVPGIGDIGGLLGFCSLGSSGVVGTLNNLCNPGLPEPESATSGVDSLISPPASQGPKLATPYYEYGMAGQYWAATDLQCSDMTSLIGNDVAGMLFDFAKALDRVTITVYQSAAGEGILAWLQGVTDRLITGIGNAVYFPYVALIVIIGAIWLAWQGLIRKRGTRTIEGTVWMVVACAAAIWLIGRPADFTGLGKDVSDGISTTLNTAFAHLPSPGQATCLPVKANDPQISETSFAYTSGPTVVDQNANELWTVLVCKPWLDGEFGTTAYTANGKPTGVSSYGRQLLWAQAIAINEKPTAALINAKQSAYAGIAQTIKNSDPAGYPLFQGKEWTTRLEIAFAALIAAVVAGLLILLISVTLILLKLGFLLLLIVGPFFLLIGTHPGFGRVVAIRWFEMLVGVLLKQAAVALALSVLLYCYALIMGTSDAVLPWALKILMITLVTVAVFIYRKPFQHLFAAVGYGAIGATDRAEADLSRARASARANTVGAATLAVPGLAAYRAARWARSNPGQAAGLAAGATAMGGASATAAGAEPGSGTRAEVSSGGSLDPAGTGTSAGVAARARAWGSSAGGAPATQAPPLRLPSGQSAPVSWSKTGAAAGPRASSTNGSAPAPPVRSSGQNGHGSGGSPQSGGGSSSGSFPPSWSSRGGSVSQGSSGPWRQGGPGSSGRSDLAQSGRSQARVPSDQVRADRQGPPRPSRFSGLAGQRGSGSRGSGLGTSRVRGRSGAGGNADGSRRADGRPAGTDGHFSAAPYGLNPGKDGEEANGPFWSRPIWRRK